MSQQTTTSSGFSLHYTAQEIRFYRFYKEDGNWYIDLPEYIQQGGSHEALRMVAGADELLDLMARFKKTLALMMDTSPFEGADFMELEELCGPPLGGGYYRMHSCRGRKLDKRIWLCDVTLFVFGDMPQHIYVKRTDTSM